MSCEVRVPAYLPVGCVIGNAGRTKLDPSARPVAISPLGGRAGGASRTCSYRYEHNYARSANTVALVQGPLRDAAEWTGWGMGMGVSLVKLYHDPHVHT